MLVVMTTVPKKEEGETLARKLVEEKLAACVQVLPQMKSFYFWQGEIQEDAEHLLLIKTLPEKYESLEKFIKENHSYTVPEIVAVPAEKVSESYLRWAIDYLLQKA
ncbi:MAG: divalent-cation tolerance protein CutA [Acidobacteria bacterium]|jgi:periplasmic divalent cation tolerance protein|nr:MAG: divalent-cation tolerance protein CutA [Acidobacteriota bacterium]GIU83115.1 MAG: divalent-cation tolerance protein CutA [Pyrinomonadaceae bacterium]